MFLLHLSVISLVFYNIASFVVFTCHLPVYFLFFFFFKQKTAYEMRISDWSSDVCSSDLDSARRSSPFRPDAEHKPWQSADAATDGDRRRNRTLGTQAVKGLHVGGGSRTARQTKAQDRPSHSRTPR